MAQHQALSAYRAILRSARIAFQGDAPVLLAARAKARESFEQYRSLAPSGDEAKKQIEHANEVADILRRNIVQGVKAGGEQEERYRGFTL
ncbi:MAG: Mitochondrial zinc maintenance protein 1, mitochondrial [Cirrosporium novae-zelandiae]|nr:MAG: Mitochondrial zinc maintenance protein 1, mitochondrial [Cirrosporium novae-zelandiae]